MTVNINFHLCSLGTETQLVHSMLANLCPQRLNEPVSYRNYCSGFKAMKFLVRFLQRSPCLPEFPFSLSIFPKKQADIWQKYMSETDQI